MPKQAVISIGQRLTEIYNRLFDCYGPQHWWPAEDPFEVVVGAILTQSAAWSNVEKAIANIKGADNLSPQGIHRLRPERLAFLIYSSGYYNAKTAKLKAFAERLIEGFGGELEKLFALDLEALRRELLSVHGIGDETADSIILYAARKPVFVVDAYTHRILNRLGLASTKDSYATLQKLFMDNQPHDEPLFNEYHAMLVRHGKACCRKKPTCSVCCLLHLCYNNCEKETR